MQKMSKTTMWVIAIAVLIVIGIMVAVMMSDKNKDKVTDTTNQPATTPTEAPPPVPNPATPSASNLSYNDALKKYGSNRIQINDSCQTTPNHATYKVGTLVMFDNRSAGGHTVVFNGVKHTIAGYGFTVITMAAAKYPATILLDCDRSQNVATLLIEK